MIHHEYTYPDHPMCGHSYDVHGMLSSSSASVYGHIVFAQALFVFVRIVSVLDVISSCGIEMWSDGCA